MPTFTIHQAKTQLSRLVQAARDGEEIVVARGRVPVVRLVPLAENEGERQLGFAGDAVRLAPDFDDVQRLW